MGMEKLVEQTLLYDFYGELLTEHQKGIYEDIVFHDYSLTEVAQNQGITRQGVHDIIKRCNKILADYENKLHLVEKFNHAKELIGQINQLTCEYKLTGQTDIIDKIQELSNHILEEVL